MRMQPPGPPAFEDLVKDDRVHVSLYDDPAIFQAEMEHIFRRAWVYAGHESEVPRRGDFVDRKSTRLNSSHIQKSRMPSSA